MNNDPRLGSMCGCVVDDDGQNHRWHPCPYQLCDRDDHFHDAELAWAAGFFEGEGTVTLQKILKDGTPFPRIAVTQNGDLAPALLQRFVDAVGDGTVHGPYDYTQTHAHTKTLRYTVQLYGKRARAAFIALRPYLTDGSPKTTRFDEIVGGVE